MATCPNGHELAEGSQFCSECGAPVAGRQEVVYVRAKSSSARTLSSDAVWCFSVFAGLGALVMFVLALIGAGDANNGGEVTHYALTSGLGAASWLIASLAGFGFAAWRSTVLNEMDAPA